MECKRLFIAIDITEEVRSTIDAYVRTLREVRAESVRWEKIEKIHLTLKFIGDTEAANVDGIESVVARIAAGNKAFSLNVEGTGVFPNAQKAKVLWIGIRRSADLERLYPDLEKELAFIGIPEETRGFNPHLTIARIRDARQAKSVIHQHLAIGFTSKSMPVGEIKLYESKLLKTGSAYSVIRSFQMKN